MANDRARFPDKRQNPDPPGASGYTQNVVVLNDFGGLTLEQRERTNKAGKTSVRMSLSVEAEPILNIFDGVYLGAGPAQALADLLTTQIRNIGAKVSESTVLRRKYMATALAKGKAYAVNRYKAARTKSADPGSLGNGDQWGNDSGMLANGIAVRQNPVEQSFTINVPANRLNPDTFGGGVAALQAFVAKLRTLVPLLANPQAALAEDVNFQRAVAESKPVILAGDAAFAKWRGRLKVLGSAIKGGRAIANVLI